MGKNITPLFPLVSTDRTIVIELKSMLKAYENLLLNV